MLIEFKVTNFRSIRDEQTLRLVASNTDTDLPGSVIECDLPGLRGVRFLKGAAIYGANASGKSNVLEAIRFLTVFVAVSAADRRPGESTETQPFKLNAACRTQPSKFEMTFVLDGMRYVLGISVTPERVVEEYLIAYPKGTPQRWYAREYDAKNKTYRWARPRNGFKPDKSLQDKTRENSLFLSVCAQFNHPQLTPLYHWFNSTLRFLSPIWEDLHTTETTALLQAAPTKWAKILNLLRSADLGIIGARLEEVESMFQDMWKRMTPEQKEKMTSSGHTPGPDYEPRLLHLADDGEKVEFDFNLEESEGTQRFFNIIGYWLNLLERGSPIFVDEIEASLHPLLVRELLKLVFSQETNPKGAQVVFTTHNPLLLDKELLRRDQVWFTEKSRDGATHLYPLTDYKPRKDEARTAGYLAGRYGGVPFIPEGLQL